jgi:type IV fimbrial biogenesis protein FimT
MERLMTSNNRMTRNTTGSRGFTLIELLMTVFLAAVLFAFAIPSFRAVIANNRLVTQTNDMVGAMQMARSEAITRNRIMTFCRTTAATDTACAGGGAATSWDFWSVLNGATIVRSGSVPTYGGGMKVTSNFTNNTIVYSSDGLARNGTSTGALMPDTAQMTVCASTISVENQRLITPGSGSRLSTVKSAGGC